jgi:cobalt-zinc-cadmium efflux system protein
MPHTHPNLHHQDAPNSSGCCSGHSHSASRGHVHGMVLSSWKQVQRLGIVLALNLGYGWVEFVGSHRSHSWALMSDAAHMMADASGILLALLAALLSLWVQKSKAFHQAWWIERLAAAVNAVALSGMALMLFYEGGLRLQNPPDIQGSLLLYVAVGGLIVNAFSVWLFHRDMKHSLNLRAAYLHMVGDMLGSIAAILSAIAILTLGWNWMDVVASLVVAVLVSLVAVEFWRSLLREWNSPARPEDYKHPILASTTPMASDEPYQP